MPAYQADSDRFAGLNAQVVGISIDSTYSHMAWQRKEIGWMDYPLASDFYPHGDVAKLYDVFREKPPIPGINERAVFVIDKQSTIQFSKVYDLGQQPSNDEVFEVLERLKTAS